jgi:hypothetical protein
MAGSDVIGPYAVDDKGHLPVGELASDRPGASSPFGDDLSFPLPAELLNYAHPGAAQPAERSATH